MVLLVAVIVLDPLVRGEFSIIQTCVVVFVFVCIRGRSKYSEREGRVCTAIRRLAGVFSTRVLEWAFKQTVGEHGYLLLHPAPAFSGLWGRWGFSNFSVLR